MAARLRLERIEIGSGASYPVVLGEPPPHPRRGLRVKRMVSRFGHEVSRFWRDLVAWLHSDTWRQRIRRRSAPLGEKALQQLARLLPKHARKHLRAVVERGVAEQIRD